MARMRLVTYRGWVGIGGKMGGGNRVEEMDRVAPGYTCLISSDF